ncbi:MAG: prolipoprotein diacylglyceryl transferase [Oscillospiraceae bacterium]|jgi:phosphatidylglycerol:prolipoprotein diacylglycerol transferase|nr:prolipoprotein diacylglyceryl transferase [Oscillospiraceae bacterium]
MSYHISFKYFNVNLNIDPTAFKIGGFDIEWYGLIVAVAFFVAGILVFSENKKAKNKIDEEQLAEIITTVYFSGIIGARIYYIIFYPDKFYFENFLNIFRIRSGGMAIYGSILAGIAAVFFVCKFKNLDFKNVLNLFSSGVILAQSIGRWGNFFNQEAFGSPTSSLFGMASEATDFIPVHPCFLYESFWCLIGFLLIKNIKSKFYFYLIWYSIGRFFIEFLRSDSLLIPNTQIKISQFISILLLLLCLIFKFKKHLIKSKE